MKIIQNIEYPSFKTITEISEFTELLESSLAFKPAKEEILCQVYCEEENLLCNIIWDVEKYCDLEDISELELGGLLICEFCFGESIQRNNRILIKKAFWAFNKKKGHWFKADCLAKIIGTDKYGRLECKTPTGIILI